MASEENISTDLDQKLLRALNKIDHPGSYCMEGEIQALHPGLHVEGFGTVGLPLSPDQAEGLKKRAIQAPYGKGTKTLVDTKVRRAWEIDASVVSFGNSAWSGAIETAIGKVRKSLGIEKHKIEAHLYKMLIYEKGGFFLPHRDSEKLDGMVATMVVVLPSSHEGGELIVRHDGQEKRFDFGGRESGFVTRFAAFYADCEHEVRPIKNGNRLCLVYNLTISTAGSGDPIKAPSHGTSIEEISCILNEWFAQARKETSSENPFLPKAILLDHDYTEAGLSFDTLKGIDRARAEAIFDAARVSNCEAWLGLVTQKESGYGEYASGYRRGGRRGRYYDYDEDDPEDYEMIEVYESEIRASHLSNASGGKLPVEELTLNPEQLVSKTPIDSRKPDKQEFEGYTGNAGMTLDRWYHRAGILIWPECMKFEVLTGQGNETAIEILLSWIETWHDAGATPDAKRRDYVEFASRIIATWRGPTNHYQRFDSTRTNPRDSRFLASLDRLDDPELVVAWIENVLARDPSVVPDTTLGKICSRHGWSTFEKALRDTFRMTVDVTIQRNASLLHDFVTSNDKSPQRRAVCDRLSSEMITAFEKWDDAKSDQTHKLQDHSKRISILHDMIRSFAESSDPMPLAKLLERIRKNEGQEILTKVHVPVLLQLRPWLESPGARPKSLNRWINDTADRLMHVIASPPRYPTDWRRRSNTSCNCRDCKTLSQFLDDPDTKTLRLPLVEDRRRHLHQMIDSKRFDVTHVTERRGRPYTLVMTKTIASFLEELKEYETRLNEMESICEILACFRSASDHPNSRKTKRKGRNTTQ